MKPVPVTCRTGQKTVTGFKTLSSKHIQLHILSVPMAVFSNTGLNIFASQNFFSSNLNFIILKKKKNMAKMCNE